MATVTIITGNARSGRLLIAKALADYIASSNSEQQDAMVVSEKGRLVIVKGPSLLRDNFCDVLLVSDTGRLEEWMQPYIEKYGDPMFHIHSNRMKG
jgi:hypothetical protein